jgi:hypothetical protein
VTDRRCHREETPVAAPRAVRQLERRAGPVACPRSFFT